MELIADNKTIVEEIFKLTSISQFIETIFVEDSIGKIDYHTTVKLGDKLTSISKVISYNLKSSKLTIRPCKTLQGKVMITDLVKNKTIFTGTTNCELINKHINNIFAIEFSTLGEVLTEKFPFYKQSIIKKVFNRNTEKKLYDKILKLSQNKTWVILPENLLYVLENEKEFMKSKNNEKNSLFLAGNLGNTSVYTNPEELTNIYFGNYDSITLILNKNLKIEDLKPYHEHYFQTTKITVDYEFIQNEEIICLEVA